MKIRERESGLVFVAPVAITILLYRITSLDFFFFLSLILSVIFIFFGHTLYLLFFNDSNSTSALFAGNAALEHGYDPVGQNGKYWNPRKLKLSEVFSLYPDSRTSVPRFDTCGFVFTYNKFLSLVESVEFYDYTHNKRSFILYKFYFSHLSPNVFSLQNDRIVETEIMLTEIDRKMIFVPLERYSREYSL